MRRVEHRDDGLWGRVAETITSPRVLLSRRHIEGDTVRALGPRYPFVELSMVGGNNGACRGDSSDPRRDTRVHQAPAFHLLVTTGSRLPGAHAYCGPREAESATDQRTQPPLLPTDVTEQLFPSRTNLKNAELGVPYTSALGL